MCISVFKMENQMASTKDYTWVMRNGEQHLVKEVLPGDEVGFKQSKTNRGSKMLIKDGKQVCVDREQADQLILEGYTKPPARTTGRIGLRSPSGEKKLVFLDEARQLVKVGWVLATTQLKSAPPQVLELAKELGMKLPKKRK